MSSVPALCDLSAQWFTQMMRANNTLAKAQVRALEITEIGLFSSQLSLVHLEFDHEQPGAPRALVAKRPASGGPDRLE